MSETVLADPKRMILLNEARAALLAEAKTKGKTQLPVEDKLNWCYRKAVEARADLKQHQAHVGEFLKEMYATMIDPLAEGTMKVAETCEKLLEAARADRQRIRVYGRESTEPRRPRDS